MLLLSSFTSDGTGNGFALDITASISNVLKIPVIASGGAGNAQHIIEVFTIGNADAALAAGIFHREKATIGLVKQTLKANGVSVRS